MSTSTIPTKAEIEREAIQLARRLAELTIAYAQAGGTHREFTDILRIGHR